MIGHSTAANAFVPRSYLNEMSVADILRNTLNIYWSHFVLVIAVAGIPLMIGSVLGRLFVDIGMLAHLNANSISLIYMTHQALMLPLALIAYGAATVLVGDICLGNRPSFGRSYGAVGACIWRFAGTNFLYLVAVFVGAVFLIVPGLILLLLFIFVPPVCILEGKYWNSAARRSMGLTKGHRLRISGITLLLYSPVFLVSILFVPFMTPDTQFGLSAVGISMEIALSLVSAIPIVGLILMYYDIRVRKENYDAVALEQDLTS